MNGENSLTLSPIDLTEGRRSVLRGRVADGAGRPQAKTMVVLRHSNGIVANMPTDEHGDYKFASLPPGAYALEVAGMGEVGSGIRLDGQNEQVRDVLWKPARPRGVIQGRVISSAGAPEPGMTARLFHEGQTVAEAESDRSGAFRFAGLPGGDYDLSVGDISPVVVPTRLQDGGTVTLEVDLAQREKKPLDRYVLFGTLPTPETTREAGLGMEMRLPVLLEFVRRTGSTGGFSVTEASQAEPVFLVSDLESYAIEAMLRESGCQVILLPSDRSALIEALDALM
jgi:hypothetical protein